MIRELTREQRELLETAERDAEILRAQAPETYRLRWFQPTDLEVMARYLGLAVPREHGGKGANSVTLGLVLAKLAEGNAALALWLAMHCFAVNEIARAADTATQERLFYRALTRPFCAAISEPKTTGQDVASFNPLELTAEFVEGKWVLNGTKTTVTGYSQSEGMVVFALDKATNSVVCLAIETGLPGMTPGDEWNEEEVDFLQPSNTISVKFKNVQVSPGALLYDTKNFVGEILIQRGARSFAYMVVYLGVVMALFDETAKLLQTPRPGQELPNSYQNAVAGEMGECYRLIFNARLMLLTALTAYDNLEPNTPMLVMYAKVGIGDTADYCERVFREEGGLQWRMNRRICRLRNDLSVASLMPPKARAARTAVGHMLFEQDPRRGF